MVQNRKRKVTRNAARCDACGTVIESKHLWDAVTCACGALTVSGGTDRPRRQWDVTPGGGWTDLTEYEPDPPSDGS